MPRTHSPRFTEHDSHRGLGLDLHLYGQVLLGEANAALARSKAPGRTLRLLGALPVDPRDEAAEIALGLAEDGADLPFDIHFQVERLRYLGFTTYAGEGDYAGGLFGDAELAAVATAVANDLLAASADGAATAARPRYCYREGPAEAAGRARLRPYAEAVIAEMAGRGHKGVRAAFSRVRWHEGNDNFDRVRFWVPKAGHTKIDLSWHDHPRVRLVVRSPRLPFPFISHDDPFTAARMLVNALPRKSGRP